MDEFSSCPLKLSVQWKEEKIGIFLLVEGGVLE